MPKLSRDKNLILDLDLRSNDFIGEKHTFQAIFPLGYDGKQSLRPAQPKKNPRTAIVYRVVNHADQSSTEK